MDYNVTMACDGKLFDGLPEILENLYKKINIHIVTADTFGDFRIHASKLKNISASIIPLENQDKFKLEYIDKLGMASTVFIGNGRNDRLALKNAALGIVVIQEEGASVEALTSADIVCIDILSALNLLIQIKRLMATLRL